MYGIPKRNKKANGGLIVGPGTGTSDSIDKDVPEGTYILPADTTAKLGRGLPGYNGNPKITPREQPRLGLKGFRKDVPVAVSNGEYEVPPEQVHAVGAAVLDQVKDATHQPKGLGLNLEMLRAHKARQEEGPRQFFADGGQVDGSDKPRGFGLNKEMFRALRERQAALSETRGGMPGYKAPVDPAPSATTVQPGLGLSWLKNPSRTEASPGPGLGIPRRATTAPADQPRLGLPGAARKAAQAAGLIPADKDEGRQHLANGGLVEDERKPRQSSFDITNTPAAQQQAGAVPGSSARAQQMSAQFDQPVTGPRSAPAGNTEGRRALDVPVGLGQAAAGAARLPGAAGLDALRNVAAYAAGGDPATLPGGSARYRDEAVSNVRAGLERVGGVVDDVRAAGREALGVQPRAGVGAEPGAAPASAAGLTPERIQGMARDAAVPTTPTTPTRPGSAPSAEAPEFVSPAGNGYTQAGNGIAMRMGAEGVPEFTNDQAALSGARTMPAGGMAGIGDGRGGTFSQGEPGDAQRAIDSFERANQERERMIQASRRGEIGEGGGRVTVVRDSSRSPSLADIQNARLDARQAQIEGQRQQTQQGAADSAVRRAAETQRMGTEQLNQQRLQQQIAEGDLSVQDRQRLDQLRAQINDPSLTEQQRAQAMEAYNALSITPDARLRAQQEATSQQQRLIGDLYKAFSSMQTPPMAGEGPGARPMSFEEWLQPALQAIQGGRQQTQSQPAGMTLVGYSGGRPVYQDANGNRFVDG